MTYKRGDMVQLHADPSRQGIIIADLSSISGIKKYRVFHSSGTISEYFEDQLAIVADTGVSDLARVLFQGQCSTSDQFRASITSARLSYPQADSLYSLYAARIQHIPFQFKPLLRFLGADQPRLLIADEVGVGKTIEAGLILRELQTRHRVESVLIICPKSLVWKWQVEMRRFDEDFRPINSENLKDCINETRRSGGEWPPRYAKSIVNLELLRHPNFLEGTEYDWGFFELDTPPHFDLVIFDEAHHLRNQTTNSHKISRFLCDCSEAVVLLTATPVHVGAENLYSLLSLLRPDLLPDITVFHEMIEPNSHLLKAMRHVRTCLPEQSWQRESLAEIKAAVNTEWGRKVLQETPQVVAWNKRLASQVELSDEERIRCLRDLEDINTLSDLVNRTRRRDIGRFTLREPHTIEVEFSQPQKEFYDALIEFQKQILSLEHDPLVVRLITDMVERQAASCLPALLPRLSSLWSSGRLSSRDVTDDFSEFDENAIWGLPDFLRSDANRLRHLAHNLPTEDPKLEQLRNIIEDVLVVSRPKKVLVFSFFLHTLDYLEQQLVDEGYRVKCITGQTPEQERQVLRDRFRLPHEERESIDILLSSEVGCEGLDYEFCDCLVNYDIPWNPMRIEQRIGRIDRFGQKSAKVLIYNFITPGTIEERVFFRCYERLDIFRNTIGDIEGVLGEVIKDINKVVYDPNLTPRQTEEMARQMTDNAIGRIEEQRRLDEESGLLLGLNQVFMDEIDTLTREGRFVSPDDLKQMVSLYVGQDKLGGKITLDNVQSGRHRLRLNQYARSDLLNVILGQRRTDHASNDFRRWLKGRDPVLSITFDQETALEHRDVAFITPVHPLTQAAVAYWSENISIPLVARLLIRDSEVAAGKYFFGLFLWENVGIQTDVRLKPFVWDIDRNRLSEDVSSSLVGLIEQSSDLQAIQSITHVDIQTAMDQVAQTEFAALRQEIQLLQQHNDRTFARQLASLHTYYHSRLAQVRSLLNNWNENIRRMGQAQKNNIDNEFEQKKREIEQKRSQGSDILSSRIALGILQVE